MSVISGLRMPRHEERESLGPASLYTNSCPLDYEWKKKLWSTYTVWFYSTTEKRKTGSFTGKRMVPESIMLSKISQIQKDE